MRIAATLLLPTAVLAVAAGCPVTPDDDDNVEEVITTVELTFTPQGGGDAIVARAADRENDGDPIIDAIVLADASDYDLTVRFLNELEDPAEDITVEVADEAAEHQVFVYGSGVAGPASTSATAFVTHAYADEDEDGLPVGLDNTLVTDAVGTGQLQIMLRHLPVQDGAAQKVEGLAGDFAQNGGAALAGDVDADVTFPLSVE